MDAALTCASLCLADPQTDVFLVCFSVISRASFDNVRAKWLPELRRYAAGAPILLVGTKADLRTDRAMQSELARQGKAMVSTEEAQALLREHKLPGKYLECSALTQEGLKGVFDEAIRSAVRQRDVPAQHCAANCCVIA